MSGSAIQQVVIGGWAGRMVWVRAACKVNSRGIKAMRIILSKPVASASPSSSFFTLSDPHPHEGPASCQPSGARCYALIRILLTPRRICKSDREVWFGADWDGGWQGLTRDK
eukprot:1101219-Rhodomonas_salina.1